ncbi:MAG TPA: hypothetical protein PKA00_18665 [Saprospiraceae bacterium]|nr:hypothetical protein [Saprospiraceae bacterium]HMQ84943.1 hypothetical protein [Saprospiraceae bacterium]
MKIYLSLLLSFLLSGFQLVQAQVKEGNHSMSQGAQNALSLEIPNTNAKLVSDVLKDFLKDSYKIKAKFDKKTDEWFGDDAEISAIGQGNTFDLYAMVEEKGENTTVYFWYNLGGAYLNSKDHPDRYPEAEKMLMQLGIEVAKANVRIELENEQKNLKGLERELDQLKSSKEKSQKEIERAQQAIKDAEAAIAQNEKDQEAMNKRIEEQMDLIKKIEKRLNDL